MENYENAVFISYTKSKCHSCEGGIGIGKIDTGGDVSENIIIGNNNQVTSNKKK